MSHWWSWWTKKSCSWCHHWLDIYFNSLALFWNPVICHGGPCAFLLTLNSFNPSVLWHCWLGGRKGIRPIKNWAVGCWHGYCLERGADLHMAQLMPLPLTVSCFSKIQIGLPFWYWLTSVVPDKGPLNGCVCVPWHCWLGIRKSIQSVKIEWWGVGVVICLERGADCLHMVQLIPLHPKTPSSLASDWFYLSGTVLPRLSNGCSTLCLRKKQDTKLLPITSPNINRFSKFF